MFSFVLLLIGIARIHIADCHARLRDPPGRSTMWRDFSGFRINYDDHQTFCGGFRVQWTINEGKCGVCGDRYDKEPKAHEPPDGIYATGYISRCYLVDTVIRVTVEITAYHKGWLEFRICPHNDISSPVLQDCLDNHLLQLTDGTTRYYPPKEPQTSLDLQLPSGMTCEQCVLQMKYNTGNSWGCDGTICGVGFGPQEQFIACSDISIVAFSSMLDNCELKLGPSSNGNTPTTTETTTTAAAAAATTTTPALTTRQTTATEATTTSSAPSSSTTPTATPTQPPSPTSTTTATSVTTPSATTPSATTPGATTPSATTPSATTPSATTPSATTPSATTQSATTPIATTPSATTPSATTPSATTPSATVTAPSPTCEASDIYTRDIDHWCALNCPLGNCPPRFCTCS